MSCGQGEFPGLPGRLITRCPLALNSLPGYCAGVKRRLASYGALCRYSILGAVSEQGLSVTADESIEAVAVDGYIHSRMMSKYCMLTNRV